MKHFTVVIPPYAIDMEGNGIVPKKAMLPVGPLMVAELLRARGHDVAAVDLVFTPKWQQQLTEAIGRDDRLLLSYHTVRDHDPCLAVLTELRRGGFRGHVTLGGVGTIGLPQSGLAKLGLHVDAVAHGYAHGLAHEIESNTTGDLVARRVDGDLPIPALDLLPKEVHDEYLLASNGRYPIVAFGLGCHWDCSYCDAKMGSHWIRRNNKQLLAEMQLAKSLGYTSLWCVDNLILTDVRRARQFDDMAGDLGLTWLGMTRAELILKHRQELPLFRSLLDVAIGVESVIPSQLTQLNRRQRNHYSGEISVACAALAAANISSTAFVILDLPKSTEGDFWELYRFLRSAKPKTVSWSFYNPPATTILEGKHAPKDFGFYRWPLGYSTVGAERVVQHAMILSGVWWQGYHLNENNPYFSNQAGFGVRFEERTIFQPRNSRSPIGDLWETWL